MIAFSFLIFRKFITAVNSPIVFSHNDLQGGNILRSQVPEKTELNREKPLSITEAEKKLTVIDFEFCSYNFRAFDIANHWAEWMYDYTLEESPYYTIKREKYPSKEQQVAIHYHYPSVCQQTSKFITDLIIFNEGILKFCNYS